MDYVSSEIFEENQYFSDDFSPSVENSALSKMLRNEMKKDARAFMKYMLHVHTSILFRFKINRDIKGYILSIHTALQKNIDDYTDLISKIQKAYIESEK